MSAGPQKPDGLTAFTSLFIRRPVLTVVLNLLIVVAGLAAFNAVEIRELPNIDRPVISVSIDFEGASPETVDRQITSEVESAVARVSGISSISSQSSFGESRVTIEFTDSTDLNVAASDVRDAISRISNVLPDSADEPRIVKADADAQAIMRLGVSAPGMRIEDLTTFVEDRVADQLAAVEGVADIQVYGDRQRVIYVDFDPDKLATRGLTPGDVSTALSNVALDVPAGSLASPTQELIVRADANVSSPAAFEEIWLNDRTRLGDVASVRFGPEDATSEQRQNGETGIGLGVVRQAGSSTLDISAGIRAEVANLNANLPEGMSIRVTSDDATFIDGAIHEVELTLGLAVLIVVAVIFLFLLNLRATLIPAVTIPVALVGTLTFIYLVGFSINILTLLALVLATGLVVDDAIIVLENIMRRRDMGASVKAAAVIGTREMFFAVVSTSATLAAVFIPISFLPGAAGGLFREFGFVLAISVALSSFIALTLCPMLAATVLKAKQKERPPGPFHRAVGHLGATLAGLYARILRVCLAFPLLVVALSGLFAFGAYTIYRDMPQELTPTEDRGTILLNVQAPQGASIDYTSTQMRRIEAMVMPYLQSGEATNVAATSGRGGANRGFLIVTLADWNARGRTQQQIAAEIDAKIRTVPGVRAFTIAPNSLGIRGGGQGLQFAVAGQNFEELARNADALVAEMNADGRWGTVRLAQDATQPQLTIEVDRQRASDLGVDIDGLATAMRSLLDGYEITQTYVEDKQVPVRLVATSDPVNDPGDLANIFLRAKDGRIIPMSTIARVEERPIAPTLARENRSRAVSIQAQLPETLSIQEAWDEVQGFARDRLPPTQRLVPLSEAATLNETNNGLTLVFGFALVIIVLVLAAQFESFVSAFIIVATVPLGVACAIYALAFFGMSLNLYSQIGLVLLVGIMAKNGILVVEFANQLREEGMPLREAVEKASLIRLRPVMMTMIATIVGGVPLIFASGAGAEARIALGYVIVGGLGLATFATLFVTPVAYLILGRFSTPKADASARLAREVAEADRRHEAEERPQAGRPATA